MKRLIFAVVVAVAVVGSVAVAQAHHYYGHCGAGTGLLTPGCR